jgi:hypothetical protein
MRQHQLRVYRRSGAVFVYPAIEQAARGGDEGQTGPAPVATAPWQVGVRTQHYPASPGMSA